MKRLPAVISLTLILALLTGCAGIPRSGSVHEGNEAGEDENSADDVTLIADAPVPGASQEDLLKGFIAAASSPLNNYAVAREFLAPDTRLDWNPDASVTLDDPGERNLNRISDSEIKVNVSPVAVLDSSGVYSERVAGGVVSQSYSFTKVSGEWRIAEAPDGILLEQSLFETVFDQHALQFYAPDWSALVPDMRWFPSGSSSATRVVTELLKGPSEWLAPAVTTAFPDGTRLARSSVPVADGEAQVDLSREALTADQSARKRMKAQLIASLENVAGAGMVSLMFDGQPIDVPTLTVREPRVDSRALIMTDDGFGYSAGEGIERIPGLSDAVESLTATDAEINSENTHIAVRAPGGVYSVQAGEAPILVDERDNLISPTIDDDGYIWTVPASKPSAVRVHDASGTAVDLQTSWPEASTIVSLEMSRDGTRIIALIESGGDSQVLLAGVKRGSDGVPTTIGETVRFPIAGGSPVSATWADDHTVAVLTSGDTDQVQLIELGGPSTNIGPIDSAVQIVGGNSIEEIKAVSADGDLLSRRGSGWQVSREGVTFIATQIGSPAT